jgi:hypothetical protein
MYRRALSFVALIIGLSFSGLALADVTSNANAVTSFSGKYGKPGKAVATLVLTLPSGTAIGSSISLSIGPAGAKSPQKYTFAVMGIGRVGLAKKGSNVRIVASTLSFKLLASAKSMFGSVVTSGSKTVAITCNGASFTSTVTFSTDRFLTKFHQ